MAPRKRFLTALPAILLATAPLGAVAQAPAGSVPVYQAPRPLFDALPVKQFGVNAEDGRAWIDVALHERFGEAMEFHRVIVPGLAFDAVRGEVVYEAGGQRTVCARHAGGGKPERVKATGACKLAYRLVMATIDNGFGKVEVPQFEVHMTVVPSGAG